MREVTTATTPKLLPGISSLIAATNELIRSAAGNDRPVFITGEIGTEKALAAKLIHQISPRAEEATTKINVSWKLPPDLSQYFERCSGGTLIIHLQREFPVDMQYTIVEMTNHGCFADPMSGDMVESKARIVLIASQDLTEMSERVPMLPDLKELLTSQHIEIPPIRSRKEDIPALVRYAIKRARDTGRSLARTVEPAVLAVFRQWHWPGNAEDLLLVTAQAAIATKSEVMGLDDLPDTFLSQLPPEVLEAARNMTLAAPAEERPTSRAPSAAAIRRSNAITPVPDEDYQESAEEVPPSPSGQHQRPTQPRTPQGTKPQSSDAVPVPSGPESGEIQLPDLTGDLAGELTAKEVARVSRVLRLARRLNAQTGLLQQQISGPLEQPGANEIMARLMNESTDDEALETLEEEIDQGLEMVLALRRQMAVLNLRQQQNAETVRDLVQRLSASGPDTDTVATETNELIASLRAIDEIIVRVSNELPSVGQRIESTLMGTIGGEREPTTSGMFRKLPPPPPSQTQPPGHF